MKPVEEIARELRDAAITKLLDMTRQECCGHGVGGDISSPPECCGTPDNLWQDNNAENALTVVAKAFDEAVAAALRAEREISDKSVADYESAVRSYARELANANARAEKAEAERDEVLWDARFQIDAQVKSREAAEARAEKAEAERDEKVTDLFDRLRDVEAERDVAESALATARNRALEEAAECVKDCRQWEPECPHAARILSLRIPEAST